MSSVAGLDGVALAATTGVTWALARFARTTSLHDATVLGLWCAAAAAVRPMSLVFAAAAGAMALVVGLRQHGRPDLLPLTTRLAAPTAVLVGWYHLLNFGRYGDVTGSAALFEKLGYEPNENLATWLLRSDSYVKPFTYLVSEVYGRNPWVEYEGARQYLVAAAALGVLVTAVVLAARGKRTGNFRAWCCVAILAPIPVVLTAQHMAGGGGGHPRYLLPILPIVAAATAFVATRVSRWIAVALVGAYVVAELTRLRAASDLHAAGDNTPAALSGDLLGQPFQALALGIALAGALALLVFLVLAAREPSGEPAPGGTTAPARE